MTSRNPLRNQYDAANSRRRSSFARDRTWIAVYHAGDSKPAIQDVSTLNKKQIHALLDALNHIGIKWEVKHGIPNDMREREE